MDEKAALEAGRTVANLATAAVVARGGWTGRATAASLLALTAVDGQAARTLHRLSR